MVVNINRKTTNYWRDGTKFSFSLVSQLLGLAFRTLQEGV